MKTIKLKSALSHAFSGNATAQELLIAFCCFIPVIAAVVIYCVTHHFSR